MTTLRHPPQSAEVEPSSSDREKCCERLSRFWVSSAIVAPGNATTVFPGSENLNENLSENLSGNLSEKLSEKLSEN